MRSLILLLMLLLNFNLFTHDYEEIKVGISENYAPYQFIEDGKVSGIDAEIIDLILKNMDEDYTFIHDDWNNIVAKYKFDTNLTLVTGMEITESRKQFTKFTTPLYERKSAIFVQKGSYLTNINALKGRVVTSDRDSTTEDSLKRLGLLSSYRLKNTPSKRESMELLATGKADAVIMPLMVGYYFAREFNIEVEVIYIDTHTSPVGIAVKKEHLDLLIRLNNTIRKLHLSGEIEDIILRWQVNQPEY